MRLIDADALKETIDYYIREAGWSNDTIEALGWVKDEFIDAEPTVQAVPIPENATNGDVIKAMFPNTSIHYHKADELIDDYVSVNIMGCDTQQDYSADWWNTPYKGNDAE